MTFRQTWFLFWAFHLPAILSVLVALFMPEKLFANAGMYHSARGVLMLLPTIYFTIISWFDFSFLRKKSKPEQKLKVSIFLDILCFLTASASVLLFEVIHSFSKGEYLDGWVFYASSLILTLLIVLMFFAFRSLDYQVKEDISEE